MEIEEIHNTDNAETSNAHASFKSLRNKPLKEQFEELERKHDKDEKDKRKAPTISRFPLHTHQNRAADFKPRVVSIGPFFHGDPKLELMEAIKVELMFDLLSRKKASELLPKLEEKLGELQDRAKNCYSGNIDIEDDKFAQMLLVDSCFIIRFLVSMISHQTHERLISLDWNIREIRSDLLMIGNQIPLFVVWNVHGIIQESCKERNLPRDFNEIVGEFIRMDVSWGVSRDVSCRITHHLLDLYWLYFMPDEFEIELRTRNEETVNIIGYSYAPLGSTRNIPSATELHRVAGVIFKQDKSSSIELHRVADVRLKQDKSQSSSIARFHNGVFEMSSFKIDENIKIIMTNLLGYEKNFPLHKRKVSSYMLLMDSLINTEEDVALLQRCGIVVNGLDTNLSAAVFFNETGNMCSVDYENHHFAKLFSDVQKHYTSRPKRRWASLRRDYCNSAWACISVAAAVFLLLLTVAQTILGGLQTQYTIHPTKN